MDSEDSSNDKEDDTTISHHAWENASSIFGQEDKISKCNWKQFPYLSRDTIFFPPLFLQIKPTLQEMPTIALKL